MVRWWRWHRPEEAAPVCSCGRPLETRVVGVTQRWGGEPVTLVSCLHCERCGDVRRPG